VSAGAAVGGLDEPLDDAALLAEEPQPLNPTAAARKQIAKSTLNVFPLVRDWSQSGVHLTVTIEP
jgi:hypothetical protein